MIDPKYVISKKRQQGDKEVLSYVREGGLPDVSKELYTVSVIVNCCRDQPDSVENNSMFVTVGIKKEFDETFEWKSSTTKKLLNLLQSLGFDRDELNKVSKETNTMLNPLDPDNEVVLVIPVTEEIRADIESAHEVNQIRDSLRAAERTRND